METTILVEADSEEEAKRIVEETGDWDGNDVIKEERVGCTNTSIGEVAEFSRLLGKTLEG
jgi:hypothetical protein